MENNNNTSADAGDDYIPASIAHNPGNFCSTFCNWSWDSAGVVFIFFAIFCQLADLSHIFLDGSGEFSCTFSMDGRRVFWRAVVAAFLLSFYRSTICLMDTVLHLVFCTDSTHNGNDVCTGRVNVCLACSGLVFRTLFFGKDDVEESDTKVLGGWRVNEKIF